MKILWIFLLLCFNLIQCLALEIPNKNMKNKIKWKVAQNTDPCLFFLEWIFLVKWYVKYTNNLSKTITSKLKWETRLYKGRSELHFLLFQQVFIEDKGSFQDSFQGGRRGDWLKQGCQTNFYRGHISVAVAFKGLNVILGLYTCNYSLTVKWELGTANR